MRPHPVAERCLEKDVGVDLDIEKIRLEPADVQAIPGINGNERELQAGRLKGLQTGQLQTDGIAGSALGRTARVVIESPIPVADGGRHARCVEQCAPVELTGDDTALKI